MKHQAFVLACFFIGTASAQLPILVKDEFNNNANAWWTGSGDNYSMNLNHRRSMPLSMSS